MHDRVIRTSALHDPEPAETQHRAPAFLAAGNSAVSRLLIQRESIADLDSALDKLNVPEGRVIDILGKLSAEDKKKVLTAGKYLGQLVNSLNTNEMARAVTALDAPLQLGLEWIKLAAGGWGAMDYPDISVFIRAADPGERAALKTAAWRSRFIDICNNDSMARAVTELGFDLWTKIDWMVAEGTDKGLLTPVIRSSPQDQLAPVKADDGMKKRLRAELSGPDFVVIWKMIAEDMLAEGDIETSYVGNEYHVLAELSRTGLTLSKRVKYENHDDLPDATMAGIKAGVRTAIARHMSGKWKLRIASVGAAQQHDGDYPINFELNEGVGYSITVFAGEGRATGGEDGAEFYEKGTKHSSEDTRIATFAHEMAHFMLGAPEEYAAQPGDTHDLGRTVYNDGSIMGSHVPGKSATLEIKDRHLKVLESWAKQFFPGRRVSVVR
jgi:hypothetical protein